MQHFLMAKFIAKKFLQRKFVKILFTFISRHPLGGQRNSEKGLHFSPNHLSTFIYSLWNAIQPLTTIFTEQQNPRLDSHILQLVSFELNNNLKQTKIMFQLKPAILEFACCQPTSRLNKKLRASSSTLLQNMEQGANSESK